MYAMKDIHCMIKSLQEDVLVDSPSADWAKEWIICLAYSCGCEECDKIIQKEVDRVDLDVKMLDTIFAKCIQRVKVDKLFQMATNEEMAWFVVDKLKELRSGVSDLPTIPRLVMKAKVCQMLFSDSYDSFSLAQHLKMLLVECREK
jgi:hypothetical protein